MPNFAELLFGIIKKVMYIHKNGLFDFQTMKNKKGILEKGQKNYINANPLIGMSFFWKKRGY